MPIYEYSCVKCGKQFEVLVRNQTDLPEKCPKCGVGKVVKVFSTFAVSSGHSSHPCDSCCSGDSGCAPDSCPGGACPFSS